MTDIRVTIEGKHDRLLVDVEASDYTEGYQITSEQAYELVEAWVDLRDGRGWDSFDDGHIIVIAELDGADVVMSSWYDMEGWFELDYAPFEVTVQVEEQEGML